MCTFVDFLTGFINSQIYFALRPFGESRCGILIFFWEKTIFFCNFGIFVRKNVLFGKHVPYRSFL